MTPIASGNFTALDICESVCAEELKSHYFSVLIILTFFFFFNLERSQAVHKDRSTNVCVCVYVCIPGGGAGGTAGAPRCF